VLLVILIILLIVLPIFVLKFVEMARDMLKNVMMVILSMEMVVHLHALLNLDLTAEEDHQLQLITVSSSTQVK
jgi:hypothetical protein